MKYIITQGTKQIICNGTCRLQALEKVSNQLKLYTYKELIKKHSDEEIEEKYETINLMDNCYIESISYTISEI